MSKYQNMKRKLAVILVNYNQRNDLLENLGSFRNSTYQPYQIIVSDNGSKDGSIEVVKAKFPNITVILNNANIGYAEANNRAFTALEINDDDYILLLNTDTIITPNLFENLMTAAAESPFDILGPKIMYYDRPDTIWFAGGYFDPVHCVHYHRGQGQKDAGQYDGITECDFITGCALLISKRLYKKLHGLRAAFFMYCEDLDLCLRARKLGFRIGYVLSAPLYHKTHDISFYDATPMSRYYYARNMLYTIREYYRTNGIQCSYTKSLLNSIFHHLKLTLLRPCIGLAGLAGIYDFLLSRKGKCSSVWARVFKHLPDVKINL